MSPLLVTDDLLVFEPTFGTAIAIGTLAVPVRGSALASVDGRALCIERDVTSITTAVAYSTPACPVPGSGSLTVEPLGGEQLSAVSDDEGRPLVLAAGRFKATLEVVAPAIGPPPTSKPDSATSYGGQASFKSVATVARAD